MMLITAMPTTAQTSYDYNKLQREQLNRGVVAIRTADGKVAVSWRTLMSDPKGQPYDVYRNGVKLNTKPLTTGGTFFIDEQPLTTDATYEVTTPLPNQGGGGGGAVGGGAAESFTLPASSPVGYIPIPIQKPEGRYSANDCSVGDVDGDGQYEIFLKWEPGNARDNSHDGYTDPVFIDCYKIDSKSKIVNSKLLWRIDLGKNIRAGAHYTQFMVYDFDGDGRAELMCRTADGTRDGQGRVLGDSLADYRNQAGRILDGPEHLTVFDGQTGRALDSKPYIPQRGDVSAWGDSPLTSERSPPVFLLFSFTLLSFNDFLAATDVDAETTGGGLLAREAVGGTVGV
jgi:rhamnogalacturonan endolyase